MERAPAGAAPGRTLRVLLRHAALPDLDRARSDVRLGVHRRGHRRAAVHPDRLHRLSAAHAARAHVHQGQQKAGEADQDVRPLGFTGFLLLMPLALTSTKGWIRRLGKRWVTLHRLVYVSTLFGIIHFFWVTKADNRWPMFALGVWAVLMTLRLAWWLRSQRARGEGLGPAQRSSKSPSPPPPPPRKRGLTT